MASTPIRTITPTPSATISRGRFAINLVNAWYKPELLNAGIGFPEHDERYAYGGEWLEVVRRLMDGERVSFQGEYFQVTDYELRPTDAFRARPRIYLGGESDGLDGFEFLAAGT